MIEFKIKGKVKNRIRCRAFAILKRQLLEEQNNEFHEMIKNTPIYDKNFFDEEKFNEDKNKWTDVYIELNTINPNIEFIKKMFNNEKVELIELVKHFEYKIRELKADPNTPKIKKDDKGKIIEKDYTSLQGAFYLHDVYNDQLIFINQCLEELK
jgi:hypothetical protein